MANTSRPSNSTLLAVIVACAGMSRMIERQARLLPDPDSPTSPTVSPGSTANSTPRTTSVLPAR
jgi:hypothetical protein